MKELDGKIIKFELVDSNEKEDKVIITDVKLPNDAPARVKTLKAEGKKWYVTVIYLPNSEKPYALFCTTNHREQTAQTSDAVDKLLHLADTKGILKTHIDKLREKIENDNNINKLTRSLSLLLRHNVPIPSIIRELDKVDSMYVGSFLFQIKKFLSQYIKDGEKVEGSTCESCGSDNLVYSEGCIKCLDCGSGACG